MADIFGSIKNSIRGLFSPTQAQATSGNQPAVLPVPTPSEQMKFGGANVPIANKTDMTTGNLTSEPSWDANRYSDPSQMDKNLATNNAARVSSGGVPAVVLTGNSSTPANSTNNQVPTGTLTADILKSKFGFNDQNVINGILNDPTKRAQYERELASNNSNNNNNTSSLPTKDQIKSSLKGTTVDKYLTDTDLTSLLDQYGKEGRNDVNQLAADLEKRAREKAQRDYDAILTVLKGQKEEIGTLSDEQKANADKQLELGTADLTAKKDSSVKEIDKQKTSFQNESEDQADTLARNWRDMSLQVQRVMRGRGASDTAFGAGEETKLLLDFNKGLSKLAQTNQGAMQDFADAVIETNDFYNREQTKLDENIRVQKQDIDSWVRSQVKSIQAQETMALNDQLDAIDAAISQGDQLKVQMESKIRDQKLNYGLWLAQAQQQLKIAVATAATGKTDAAASKIKDYRDLATQTMDLITKGGYALETVTNKDGTTSFQVHGKLPNGQDDVIPVTQQGYNTLQTNAAATIAKNLSSNNPLGAYTGDTTDIFNNVYGSLGGTTKQEDTTDTSSGGLFSSLKSWLSGN